MKFKKGQKVRLLIHGAGVTSEEKAIVTCVSKHQFWLNREEPNKDAVFSLDTGKRKGVFGFSFEVLTKGDEAKMAAKKKKVAKKKSVKKSVKKPVKRTKRAVKAVTPEPVVKETYDEQDGFGYDSGDPGDEQ